MVKSHFRTLVFRLILFMTFVIFLLLLLTFSQAFLRFNIIKMSAFNSKEGLSLFIILLLLLTFFGSQIWRDAKFITVDTLSKSITFSNFFTRKKIIYSFDGLEGFIDMYQRSRNTSYRVIYLIKDRRYIEKISSFYYSNLEDIQEALAPTKYLGRQKFNILKSIQILFNRKIVD